MARQTGKFPFIGRVGNMIGYKRNGVYYMRSVPEKVTQTKATKKAANNFGKASNKGGLIRNALKPHLDVICDKSHVYRLNSKLIKSSDLRNLPGFRFNNKTGIDQYFHMKPVLTENNILQIPKQQIPDIFKHTLLDIKLIATKIDLGAKRIIDTVSHAVRINSDKPFSGLQFEVNIPGNGTLIMALQVRGLFEDGAPSHDKRWAVADIIAVVPQNEQTGKKKTTKKDQPNKHGTTTTKKKGDSTPPTSSSWIIQRK